MKGVVFVELLRMAETAMGEEVVDDILDQTNLETDAAYTTVGNYPCGELLTLVEAFGAHLKTPPEALQTQFGHWMFGRFVEGYPAFFQGMADAFDMLEAIDGEVHVEVRKLYPEVELPRFETERLGEGQLKMIYDSERPLSHFCLGLIRACVTHFGQKANVDMIEVPGGKRHRAEFLINMAA